MTAIAEATYRTPDVRLCTNADRSAWQAYVADHPRATLYHDIGWRDVVEETFGHPTYYLMAEGRGGEVVGVLPLVYLKSRLFGRVLVSLPYFNYGGLVADGPIASRALLTAAIEIARSEGARHIELRHTDREITDLPAKSTKVSMRLGLPEGSDELWRRLGSKLRSQIQRPLREGMSVAFGQLDQLDAFYEVFAENMRDLGTPVYPRRFFEAILRRFPDRTALCTVYHGDRPVASGFLVAFRDTVEIPWASSLRRYNRFGPNMLMYWQALKFACDTGHRVFDFGRSSPDSGTYRFKAQWGAAPVALHWHYWQATPGPLPELSPANPKYRLAIRAWQRLPVAVTRALGPAIVKWLP